MAAMVGWRMMSISLKMDICFFHLDKSSGHGLFFSIGRRPCPGPGRHRSLRVIPFPNHSGREAEPQALL
jgi:hypothetical protein